MYNSSVITQKNIFRINSRSKSEVLNHRKALVFVLVILIALSGILYVACANSVATGGYETQEHKAKLGDLKAENKMLELQLSKVKSFAYLEKKVDELNMTEVDKVEYISPISQVAAK